MDKRTTYDSNTALALRALRGNKTLVKSRREYMPTLVWNRQMQEMKALKQVQMTATNILPSLNTKAVLSQGNCAMPQLLFLA